jgi:demethylmenaquinone methyltransferase/2-methoxy-6-polyprenyl-1,4-benzoquinol methylase
MEDEKQTHFGYETIPLSQKADRVNAVFSAVSDPYDRMNDFMSAGLHRLWKRTAVSRAQIAPGHRVLDLAAGTGDLSRLIWPRLGDQGEVVMADLNANMLHKGRGRLLDRGYVRGVRCVQTNAEQLALPSGYFDRVIIGFGLRNVSQIPKALAEMHRVLKPGGRLTILEFSHPTSSWLSACYDRYSFSVLPKLGEWVANDAESYRYLAESIRMHPDQEALLALLNQAGFSHTRYTNLAGGIVAIHQGARC